MSESGEMRLHRYLALCGVASRRKAEEIILEGRVQVNGETIDTLGTKVSEGDVVLVDGAPIRRAELRVYLLNKPSGYVTTMFDPQRRRTVRDLVPESAGPIKPVGRLDMNSTGLLLLTNDGDLAARLTHARYGVEKEYDAVVQGYPDEKTLARLRRGIGIDGRKTAPSEWNFVSENRKDGTTRLRVILHEGRNRQIRKMAETAGHPVVSLRRIRIGPLTIKGMNEGELRLLGQKEYAMLRRLVRLDADSK